MRLLTAKIIFVISALSLAICRQFKIDVKVKENSLKIFTSFESSDYTFRVSLEQLKELVFIYNDCATLEPNDPSRLNECTKTTNSGCSKSLSSKKSVFITKWISFVEHQNIKFEHLRIIPIDFSEGKLTFFAQEKGRFSIFGYHFDFLSGTFRLFMNRIRYAVSEPEALEFLGLDITKKIVKTASFEAQKEEVSHSGWAILSPTTGFFVAFHKSRAFEDFRVQKSLAKKALVFELVSTDLAFQASIFFENKHKAFFKIRDKTPWAKNLRCELSKSFGIVSAGLPLSLENEFMTIGASKILPRLPVSFRDLDLDRLLHAHRENSPLANLQLSLNTSDKILHFELDNERKAQNAVSFRLSFVFARVKLQIRSASKNSGRVHERLFSFKQKEKARKIRFYFVGEDKQSFELLGLRRGVIMDRPVFKNEQLCEFINGDSLIKKLEVSGENDSELRGSDFGWFEDFDELQKVELKNLDFAHILKPETKTLEIYFFDSTKFALTEFFPQKSISVGFKNSLSFANDFLESVKAFSNFEEIAETTPKVVSFKTLSSQENFQLEEIPIIELIPGQIFFLPIKKSLSAILENSPSIEFFSADKETISFVIYSQSEMLRASPSKANKIRLEFKGLERELQTNNGLSLETISLVWSKKGKACKLLSPLRIGKSPKNPNGTAFIFYMKNKDFDFYAIEILPNVSQKMNFVSVVGNEKKWLSLSEKETLFFSNEENICRPVAQILLKYSLTKENLTLYDFLSDKIIKIPIFNFEGFEKIGQVSVQEQKAEFLFCLDQLWMEKYQRKIEKCQTKRGVARNSVAELQSFFFGENFALFNDFNQPAFSLKTREDSSIAEVNFKHEPGFLNLEKKQDSLLIKGAGQNILVKISEEIQLNKQKNKSKTPEKILMFLSNFSEISGNSKQMPAKIAKEISEDGYFFQQENEDFGLEFEVPANMDPDFVSDLFESLNRQKIELRATQIKVEENSELLLVFNSLIFELLEINQNKLCRWFSNSNKSSYIQKDNFSSQIKTCANKNESMTNEKILSNLSEVSKNFVEDEEFLIENEFDFSENALCLQIDCIKIKVIKAWEIGRGFILAEKKELERITSKGKQLSLRNRKQSDAFLARNMKISRTEIQEFSEIFIEDLKI